MEYVDSSEFIVAAPDLQLGLSSEIERGAVPREFLNRYHADHDIRCAFCSSHTLHRRGFTVRLDDGRIALCGIDCGREFFGDEVADRFANDLEDQIRRRSRRNILARTVDGAPEALRVLNENWIKVEAALMTAAHAVKLWCQEDDIVSGMSGELLISKSEKVRWDTGVGRDGRETRVKSYVEKIHARVSGAQCLLAKPSELSIAKGGLASLANWGVHSKNIDEKNAEKLMEKRAQTIKSLRSGVEFVRSANKFFQPENIDQFLKWYGRIYTGDYPQITIDPSYWLIVSSPDPHGKALGIQLPRVIPEPDQLIGPLTSRG